MVRGLSSLKGERGAALWIALMFLLLVMVLTVIGSRITVSMLRGEESREKSGEELWAARGVAADLEARLRYDLPTQLLSDVAAAKQMPGGTTSGLGEFDSTATTTSYPVAVVGGGQLVANPNLGSNTPTSLLGVAESWAQARAAQSVTSTVGGISGTANLQALFELKRNPPYNVFLHYIVDAKAAFNRVRPTGEVQLLGQTTPIQSMPDVQITESGGSSAIAVGQSVLWTITATNNGAAPATGVTIMVNLSSQGSNVNSSFTTASFTRSGAPGQCTVSVPPYQFRCTVTGALPSSVNNTATLTVTQQVNGFENGTCATPSQCINNTVSVSMTEVDATPQDNNAAASVPVTTAAAPSTCSNCPGQYYCTQTRNYCNGNSTSSSYCSGTDGSGTVTEQACPINPPPNVLNTIDTVCSLCSGAQCSHITYQQGCGPSAFSNPPCRLKTATVCCPAGQTPGFVYDDYMQCVYGTSNPPAQVCPISVTFTCNGNPAPADLAVGATATQSSTFFSYGAGLAVDGNVNGNFGAGTSSATQDGCWGSFGQWWQVDLGTDVPRISGIDIWPRTDCCPEMSSDYYVLVSDNPISASAGLSGALSQPGVSYWYVSSYSSVPPQPTHLTAGRSGRYVMVWLNHCGYLVLAEVQVWG